MRLRFAVLLLSLLCITTSHADEQESSNIDTVYWESSQLFEAKRRAADSDENLKPILALLRRNADSALNRGPYSVTFKEDVPPSGDKHDYMSFSRYWWPNPDTPDGLPYVRRDGEVNSEIRQRGDRDQIGLLFEDIETLTLAYYLFQEEQYAAHASKLIRTWFLDPKTKMNPHLNYGQAVPGRSPGRGVGIIDSRGFIKLLDALSLLSSSDSFQPEEHGQLQNWFSDFLQWLRTSDLGKEEASAENNHGSWYAAQTGRIALFVGETEIARDIVERVRRERIPHQFSPDGSQPHELKRTQSLHYSFFNLEALSVVARVGEHLGIELWQSESESDSLRPGVQFLLPYLLSQKKWTYPQMKEYSLSRGCISLLRMASHRYNDPDYLRPITRSSHRHPEYDYAALLFRATTHAKGAPGEVSIEVSEDSPLASANYELPDISSYSVENVLKQVPTDRSGVAQIIPTQDEPILSETFRKDRMKGFQERQGSESTQVIELRGGAITLGEVARQLDDENVLSIEDGVATLRLPILVKNDATLIIDGQTTPEVRLSTARGAFIANAGNLYILQTKVTSWNQKKSQPSEFQNKKEFRPFISSYIRSSTYLAGSSFHHLGYHAPTSYGISLSSQPEREDPSKINEWPTGVIVGNTFHGIYYGFYSYEARGVAIVNNVYEDCILYGIDPHDRSTELIIAKNTTRGTRERHGIIGSRGISNSFIFDNASYANAGSGIMLDRRCFENVICDNKVFSNGQGIAIYESFSNVIADNLVVGNTKSGIRARNSSEILVLGNEVVANGDYGLEFSAKRLKDHKKRAERGDTYDQSVRVSIFDNVISGNQGGVMKGLNVSHMRLNRIATSPDISRIEKETGLTDLAMVLDDDHRFGSGLKKHSDQLERVFDANMPMVELRQKSF